MLRAEEFVCPTCKLQTFEPFEFNTDELQCGVCGKLGNPKWLMENGFYRDPRPDL